MKKKEKKMILILIIVSILIIGVIWFLTRPKDETNSNKETNNSAAQGEYTKVEEDGTIVNTSEKLKENKEMQGFELTNIEFKEKNGETILSARVTNKTGETQQTFMGNIILLDKKNNEIGRIPVRISTMEAGETRDIEATITESYANAFNFKLEK